MLSEVVMPVFGPQLAPFTTGSLFTDTNYPGRTFTVYRLESHFGDDGLFDIAMHWHEPDACRVVDYLSPDALGQRKQDLILSRLEAAYGVSDE